MICRRQFVVTGLAFVFAAGLGSSSIAQELPKLKEKKTYKVGFAQTESNNPWRLAETESVKSEAAKRGDQLVYTDAAGSAAKQVADVNSMIAQGVDVILLAPREEKPLVPAVMAAKKAGIPVILLDRSVDPVAKPGVDYLTFIGSDFVDEESVRRSGSPKKQMGRPLSSSFRAQLVRHQRMIGAQGLRKESNSTRI